MKPLSSAYATHLQGPTTTLAICWRIVKKNGEVIRGTDHDRNIAITITNIGLGDTGEPSIDLSGVYKAAAGITGSDIRSSSDMSVDNMEVGGGIDAQITGDITVPDIEAGLLDSATVTTFRVNWQNPDDYQEVMRHGSLGEISRTAEREYRTEVRGLTQVLQQIIGRTAGDRCDVKEFGDERCKYPVETITVTGTVTAVTNRKVFSVSLALNSPPTLVQWKLGKLTWTSGDNDGFVGQLKREDVGNVFGAFEMWEPFPTDIEVGDTFTLRPGCDRRYETCRDIYDNIINMRAPAIFCPGMDAVVRAP